MIGEGGEAGIWRKEGWEGALMICRLMHEGR